MGRHKRIYRCGPPWLCGLLASTLAACSLAPAWRQLAEDPGLETEYVLTGQFRHLAVANAIAGPDLTVFIEGDGAPWVRGVRVAHDPTPPDSPTLQLVTAFPGPAVFLGRPCYFGTVGDAACESRLWTADRYGDDVVRSMCEATKVLAAQRQADTVHLVGHSGGGTIALLMTPCLAIAATVTTLAGNLDPEAWVSFHGYLPLRNVSIERMTNLPASVVEYHWQCSDDDVVPSRITDRYFERRPLATRIVVDDCGHGAELAAHWLQSMR